MGLHRKLRTNIPLAICVDLKRSLCYLQVFDDNLYKSVLFFLILLAKLTLLIETYIPDNFNLSENYNTDFMRNRQM